ncbi:MULTISPECIES: hypothetical protein [unclassified Bacillus (in: firmicutes)]|uniref:hypothetical protein n=1 Tax=unclassified Bacillus (in: firmicutes) TaxID=185979 RepID=UPI000BF10AB2|nr:MULTISPECIES: hypothetical protein [unclassified Bacillus (in: firmicutes)]PEJ58020.1 hypothetical protein CN692_10580 [Bacillus sp. AFS002410]PEL13861.1 hypothetical protein CN601_02860 [Bacillus sp. AFS017336]
MEERIVEKKNESTRQRRSAKARSPFLLEKSTRTVPRTSPSLYTKDLFKRSDKAVERLKHSRYEN